MMSTGCRADGDRQLGCARDPLRRAHGPVAGNEDRCRPPALDVGGQCAGVGHCRRAPVRIRWRIQIVATAPDHVDLAREAWRRYGKGRHPAGLNICDCLAYALSKATGEPLLFVGDDFTKTDVAAA
jgi:hypothetical protein